ncbi:RraA family protein [Paraburkholderia kirstenboschensis]|uniref:Putative 4-hydroxy-4-methyl-2-oxoglutarate aldolase n=1 Tax=Paraburkholderia kirstenboschensis TaxID=1245436 RepID=A0ABZ0EKA0_9BURK|nr:RraA family protein [Paraburkholderia kirstenboschensis]WOD17001.1 RraA family protein [Paraburkholderia kirstenboschensis]
MASLTESAMSLPGFRVNPAPQLAPASVVKALEHVVAPQLSDNLARSIGIAGLTRYNRAGKLIGTAFTAKCRPGDNLVLYKALTMLQPGHVLVTDGGGESNNALVGELIKLHAQKLGCVGFVIDGAILDVASFEDFPCYARSVIHRGPYKDGPGELNVPVSVGGQVINPGDIVVGDEDGVVNFAQADADELIAVAAKRNTKEQAIQAEIATGRCEQEWINQILVAKGLAE